MTRAALVVASVLLLAAPAASAHVDVRPERAPAGSDARLTFEVPNERSDSGTRSIVIQMPSGVTSVKALSLRGWRLTARGDGAVRRATLTAPRGRELTGEERGRFRLRVGLPRREGATLTFKVVQRYEDGEIVRWLGPPGTSEPAATLRLTAARAPEAAATAPADGTAAAQDGAGEDKGDDGVPIWAGIGLILLAAWAGSALARRRNRRRIERLRE